MKKKHLTTIAIMCTCALSLAACKQVAAVPETTEAAQTESANDMDDEAPSRETQQSEAEEMGETKETEKESGADAESGQQESEKEETDISASAAGSLSDDIYDFQVSVGGTVYQFPMPYEPLTADGWRYQGDETRTIRPGAYGVSDNFKKGDNLAIAYLVNFGINETPVNECYLGGIMLETFGIRDNTDVILAKGIQLGKSSVDDIKAAYGEPTNQYEGDLLTSLTYERDSYSMVKLSVEKDTGYLTKIDIKNLEEPEDLEPQEVDTSVPAIAEAYKAPDKISDSLTEYSVEFAGDLYSLPVPVSQFIENGWSYVDADGETVVPGQDSEWVTLMKDNQKFKTLASNYSRSATSLENCFVVRIEAGEYKCKLPMTVAGGVTLEMTEDELTTALEKYPVKTDLTGNLHYYTVEGLDSPLDGYVFTTKDGKIMQIDVQYEPKLAKYYQAMGVEE